MGVCDDLIKKDISYDCVDPVVPGFEPDGVIMNRSEVDFATSVLDTSRKNVFKTLAVKAGKKGFSVAMPGRKPFSGTKTSMVEGTYRNSFDSEVSIVIFNNDPDVCADIIDGLANGTYVLVLENKYKGLQKEKSAGDAAFQVYGWYQGLYASAMENDKYSEDTDGGWLVTLKETKSPKSAMFLYNTDYDTTKKQIATLISDPTV